MDVSALSILIDFAIASALIVLGQLLRSKIKFIQNMLLPASLLAGILGLLLRSFGLLPFSSQISSYSAILASVLFAGMFIGEQQKQNLLKTCKKVRDTFALNLASELGQFGFVVLIGTFILKTFFPSVPDKMPVLAPGGFVGGHGYAAGIGSTITGITGWDEAVMIGQTFATIGILCGVFGGIVLIKIAVKKSWTSYIGDVSSLDRSMRTGFIESENQPGVVRDTTSSISIESFTWHFGLLLTATGLSYGVNWLYEKLGGTIALPMVCLAMLCGMFLNLLLRVFHVSDYVNRKTISKMTSSITDYLVFFGVASIKIEIVFKYFTPIILMCILCLTFSLLHMFVFSRKYFNDHWFERAIFIYGWSTGVVAIGITLLRIVDPDAKSNTLEDYGIAYAVISFIEIAVVALYPVFISYGYSYLSAAVLIAAYIVLILLARRWKSVQDTKNPVEN